MSGQTDGERLIELLKKNATLSVNNLGNVRYLYSTKDGHWFTEYYGSREYYKTLSEALDVLEGKK